MTEREAFLKAICDNPDDDTPRLVYADWLTEHGEPERAEFIRVQCELARTPELVKVVGPDRRINRTSVEKGGEWWEPNPRNAELQAREKAIDPTCLDAEVNALVAWGVRPSWSRGFVHSVTCPGDDWARHGDAVLREHPVREVTFTEFRSLHLPRSFYTGPFPNWLAIDEVFQEYRLLTHPETGEPVFTPTLVIWADVFTRRWPGVTFRPAE